MIELTPDAVYREIEAAIKRQAPSESRRRQCVRKYATAQYFSAENQGVESPENYHYAFPLHLLARTTAGKLRVRFGTERASATDRVRQLEKSCNRWVRATRFARERELAILDMSFGWCAYVVTPESYPGCDQIEDPPQIPKAVRLSPSMFGMDARCAQWEDARIAFHVEILSRAALRKRAETTPGWDIKAVDELVKDDFNAEWNRKLAGVHRDEVAIYHVWLRQEHESAAKMSTRDRTRNATTTLVLGGKFGQGDGKPRFLREPMPYYGPRSGPYAFGGILQVPDEAIPTSPLISNEALISQLNAQCRANDRMADNAKDVVLLDGMTADGKPVVIASKHGDVLAWPGLAGTPPVTINIGGPSKEMLEREETLRNRVERNLGMPDVVRGEVDNATATANIIADRSSGFVMSFMERKVNGPDEQVFEKVAWFFDQDERVIAQTEDEVLVGGSTREERRRGIERAVRGGMLDEAQALAAAQGVDQSPEYGSFDDLELEVVQVKSDGSDAALMTDTMNILLQAAPLVPQIAAYSPGLKNGFERLGETRGMPELGEFFDLAAAAKFGEAMMQAQAEPAPSATPVKPPKSATATPNITVKAGGGKK